MSKEKVVSGEMDEDEFFAKAMTILQRKVERLKHVKKCAVQTNTVRGGAVAA